MLWNYLQQLTFHLHSSITKYIVKTFVIFAALLHVLGLCPVTQTFSVLAPFSQTELLGLKILPHTFKTKDSVYFSFLFLCVWYQFCATRQIQIWAKLGALMEFNMKERCVLWSNKDSIPLCQTEKAICIKGQHAFKNQLPSTPFGKSA